jgi:hypothetical protein
MKEKLIILVLIFLSLGVQHQSASNSYYYHISLVKADISWEFASGQGVTVAIIDTAFDLQVINSNLFTNTNEIPGNGIDDDSNGFIDDYHGWDFRANDFNVSGPYSSHGTEMATTLIQYAPNVTVLPIKFLSSTSSVDHTFGVSDTVNMLPNAINYAVLMGAKVISMSIGIDATLHANSLNAINNAFQNNITLVAASGNDNKNHLYYPAAFDNVISVGSIDEFSERSIWDSSHASNYADNLDFVAPGSQIYTTSSDGNLVLEDGTSFSTVAVSALASCLYELQPLLTPSEVKGIIKTTSSDLGDIGFDSYFGFGLINFAKAVRITSDSTNPTFISSDYSITKISNSSGIFNFKIIVQDDSGFSSCELYYKGYQESTYSINKFCSGPIYSNKTAELEFTGQISISGSLLQFYYKIFDIVDKNTLLGSSNDPIIISTGLKDILTSTTSQYSSSNPISTSSAHYTFSTSSHDLTSIGEWITRNTPVTANIYLISIIFSLVFFAKRRIGYKK